MVHNEIVVQPCKQYGQQDNLQNLNQKHFVQFLLQRRRFIAVVALVKYNLAVFASVNYQSVYLSVAHYGASWKEVTEAELKYIQNLLIFVDD